jgi:hypothetical protein
MTLAIDRMVDAMARQRSRARKFARERQFAHEI